MTKIPSRIKKKRNSTDLSWKQKNPDYYLYRRSKAFIEVKNASRSLSYSREKIAKLKKVAFHSANRPNSKTSKITRRRLNDRS